MSDRAADKSNSEAGADPQAAKTKIWRVPQLQIVSIAQVTAAKGNNPVEVGPGTGPIS